MIPRDVPSRGQNYVQGLRPGASTNFMNEPTKKEAVQEAVKQVLEKLAAEGKVIGGGWAAFELMTLQNASELQKREMRTAFFAGAQHLWSSIFAVMDSDREPTEEDMRRMSLIDAELRKFYDEMKLRGSPSE